MAEVLYGIHYSGDPMGGSRDSIQFVSKEEAERHVPHPGWSRAVRVKIEPLRDEKS